MGFERCHPAVNFIYFAAVIAGTVLFTNPAYVAVSYVCAFIYSVKRNGWNGLLFDLALLPFIAAFMWYYISFNHFGATVLWQNSIGNNMTLEALVCGLCTGFAAAAVIMWMSCVHSVVSADKVVYLFGRISPRLALFLAVLLRMVPRIKKETGRINTAQKGIGKGASQGGPFGMVRNWIRIFSIMISWIIEAFGNASDSMRSRGSLLRGRRAFSIYRFDDRDRVFVVAMFFFISGCVTAMLLKQTAASFSPRIIIPPFTAVSVIFCVLYAALCLMPFVLEVRTEIIFRNARRRSIS